MTSQKTSNSIGRRPQTSAQRNESASSSQPDWETVFRVLHDPGVILGPDFRILHANRAAQEAVGCSEEELNGRHCYEIFHGTDGPPAGCPLAKLNASKHAEIADMEVELLHGTYRVSCTPILDDNGNIQSVIHLASDITERKRAEEEQQKQIVILEKLNALSRLLTEELTLGQSLEKGLEIVLSAPFLHLLKKGGIFLAEPGKRELTLKYSYNLPQELQTMCARVAFGHCLCGRAASTDQIQFADCLDERHENRYEGIQPHGHYAVPISAEGQLLGVIIVYLPEGYATGFLEVTFLRSAADIFSAILNRRRAEQSLRESEERYHTLVEEIPAVVYIDDASADIGQTVFISPQVETIFGISAEAWMQGGLGLWSDLIHPDDRSRAQTEYLRCLEGREKFDSEYRVVTPDGRLIWIRDQAMIARDEKGHPHLVHGVMHDITERKQAEQAAEDSNRQVKSILDCAGEGIFGLDLSGGHIFANPAAAHMLGYETADELIGLHSHSIWHYARPNGEVYPEAECPIYATLHDGKIHSAEDYFWRKDGAGFPVVFSSRPILENEKIVGAVVSFRDISERKQADENLSASEAELRALFASMQDAVLVLDRDGVYRKIAPTNPTLLFRPTAELLGKNLRELFPSAQAEAFLDAIRQVLDTRQSVRIEYELLIAGRPKWFSTSISPMDADSTLWVARDITERKQADAALRESEERYHSLFDSMMDGIYRSTHDGKFMDVNPAMVKMFGYSSREEMLAVDIKKELYFSPEERGSHILDTGQEEIEAYRMRRKDGSEIWVEDHGYYIHDQHGQPIYHVGMIRDITERKQAEDALVKLKKAVDTSIEAIFLTDLEGIFTYVNPGFTTLYGYSADEVVGKVTPRILKSGLLNQHIYVEFWKTLVNGQEVKGELINKRKNGKLVDVEVFATPILDDAKNIIGFLGIQHDITERKQAELVLQVAEANFRSIFENATVGIYQSTPPGRFLSVNPVMARIFGFDSPEEMVAGVTSIENQYYVDPVDRYKFQRLMIEQGEAREFTSWNYRKNGERIWVQESARAVKDAHGNVLYYEGFVSDMTERKQSEDELRYMKESLESVNRELQQLLLHEQVLSRTDDLTGLCNRRQFFELAGREFTAALRYQRPLSVLMFDADEFKQVNDIFGHAEGDNALTQIAQIAAAQVRAVDVLARYGGDEFVLLLPQADAQQAFQIAERIRASVAATIHVGADQSPFTVTLSIGISELQRSPMDEDIERVIQRADEALYAAKAEGRNRTVIFNSEV